eukprot:7181608-Pyramimonas_sp.AAC.1
MEATVTEVGGGAPFLETAQHQPHQHHEGVEQLRQAVVQEQYVQSQRFAAQMHHTNLEWQQQRRMFEEHIGYWRQQAERGEVEARREAQERRRQEELITEQRDLLAKAQADLIGREETHAKRLADTVEQQNNVRQQDWKQLEDAQK